MANILFIGVGTMGYPMATNLIKNKHSLNFYDPYALEKNIKKLKSLECIKIESLKISIRDLNKDDISRRELPKNTTGVVITEISEESPLMFVSVNDVIVELQKKKVINSSQFSKLAKEIINKGATTLYLAIFNSSNQRSYITVKLK